MAKFIGTIQEFHNFLGPRIRNMVNLAAARHRKKRNRICEECGNRAELQSAHVHGRGRRQIIEAVLAQFKTDENLLSCDLDLVEKQILESHLPIEETFRFLCHPCHVAYDAKTTDAKKKAGVQPKNKNALGSGKFQKLGRIELWANRPHQACSQILRAFLQLEMQGRPVTLSALRSYCTDNLKVGGFDANYASMKTDAGNSYGKVFFDVGEVVDIWPEVRQETYLHFKEKPLSG